MIASAASSVLAAAIIVFLMVASAILVWDGLGAGLGKDRSATAGERWRARGQVVIGALGVAIALWAGLGILTHAR